MRIFVATHTTSTMSLKRKESPPTSDAHKSKKLKHTGPVLTAPTTSVQIETDSKKMEEAKIIAMQKKAYTEIKEKIECERAQRAKELLEGDYKDYLFEATEGCKRTWDRVVFSGHIPISIIDPTKEIDLSTLIPAVRLRHYNHTQAAVVIIPSDKGTPVIKLIDIKTAETFDKHSEWHKTVYTRYLETGGPRAAKEPPSRTAFGHNYIFYKPLADVEQWESMATLADSDMHVAYSATKKKPSPPKPRDTEDDKKIRLKLLDLIWNGSSDEWDNYANSLDKSVIIQSITEKRTLPFSPYWPLVEAIRAENSHVIDWIRQRITIEDACHECITRALYGCKRPLVVCKSLLEFLESSIETFTLYDLCMMITQNNADLLEWVLATSKIQCRGNDDSASICVDDDDHVLLRYSLGRTDKTLNSAIINSVVKRYDNFDGVNFLDMFKKCPKATQSWESWDSWILCICEVLTTDKFTESFNKIRTRMEQLFSQSK